MINYDADCSNLVVLHGYINGVVVSVHGNLFLILLHIVSVFIFVDDGVLRLEVVNKVFGEHGLHGFAVEGKNSHHVLPFKLQVGVVENGRVLLKIYKLENVGALFAVKDTLKQQQLTNVHLLNVHLIDGLENGLAILVFVLVLDLNDLVFTHARKQDVVVLVDFKIVAGAKSVHHVQLRISAVLQDLLLLYVSQGHGMHAFSIEGDVVL